MDDTEDLVESGRYKPTSTSFMSICFLEERKLLRNLQNGLLKMSEIIVKEYSFSWIPLGITNYYGRPSQENDLEMA